MFVLVLFILILFPYEAQEGAKEGLRVAFETVIPSILPFSVMSCALVYSGFVERLGEAFTPLSKRLHVSPYGIAVLLMGLLGGYPTGCKLVCDIYKEGLCSKEECEKMLSYVNNGGLIFAVNVCGGAIFNSKGLGLWVFLISAISAFICALLLGRGENGEIVSVKKEKLPFMATLGKSVASGGGVVLNIVSSFVVFYAVSNALNLGKMPFVGGCVEMTKGLMYAGKINSLPLAVFFFTLGGVGVFSQSAAICSECDLSMKGYLKGKTVSSVIAFIIAHLIFGDAFIGKDIIIFSFLVTLAVIASSKVIKKLYALA